jgi:uncharacterized repeat protein (TIGR01451 family)
MPTREVLFRKDSRLFTELCASLLRRGHHVRFRVQGASMQPNLRDGDTVVVAPASVAELRSGDVAFVETSHGLRVHRVKQIANGAVTTQGDTGLESDPQTSRVLGRAASISRDGREFPLTSWRTRFVHPVAILARRLRLATKNRLRSISSLLFGAAALLLLFAAPGVHGQTADLQLTQTASASAVDTNGTTQSLGTAGSATWSAGVATFTFPTPLPSGVYVNALLTTTGFTPAAYNVTAASITSVNNATGVVTVALASQSLGAATAATWSANVASFTFPTPLPSEVVVGAQLTTTGFAPAAFNVTNATITAVNTTTGVVSVSLPNQSMGSATSATWNASVASFTFPTPLPSEAVVGALLTTTGFTPAAYNVTNAAVTSVNAATGVVTVALASQSVGTATVQATWAGGVATYTFPNPLPSFAVAGSQITTAGFAATYYNLTNATIASANSATGVVTVSLPAQSLGTATGVTYNAGGTATYTFATALPSFAVVGALVTTTGFTPARYNVTNVAITTVNTGARQITLTVGTPNPGAVTVEGTGTVNPATSTTRGTGTVNPATTATANGSGTINPATPATGNGTGTANPASPATTDGTGTVPTGFTFSEVVTNNNSSAVVATGTITAYMQTPANTVFESYSGANWTCTTPAVGSQGPIICTYNSTLASGSTASTLILCFQIPSGTAYGTTIQSSATVTNSTDTDPTPSNNTSLSTIIVEPTTASDLGVTMSVAPTPVFVSSTFTYTIQVQNLGQASAPASSNVLTDTLPSGLTNVNVTAPSGWSCSGTATVNCSITSPMAANTTASITISASTPATATTLTNTATINLSGDPNSSNNSATAYTVVQPIACATPGRDGAGGTLTGVVNAYYPPASAGTLASASTSVTLGAAATGGAQTAIAAGDLLLIMQMQDATINATNTSSYGDGLAGDPASGATILGSSGLFEFVTATGSVPVGGGTLTFTGTGPTGGLLNTYSHTVASTSSLGTASAASWTANVASFTFPSPIAASVIVNSVLTTTGFTPAAYNVTNATILTINNATGVITVSLPLSASPGAVTTRGTGTAYSQGQQTFQVIRVPQYSSATLSSGLVPLAWNGSVGGVLAIDVSSQLTLGGPVSANALGFRGGGTQLLTGPSIGGTNTPTDYVTFAPANNTTATGSNGPKGEGIAGTPRYIAPAGITTTSTPTDTTGGTPADSLPGGSYARGAPGNAGGGGTDGDPQNNDYNSGGGGGSNGGSAGQGGYGWNSMASTNTTDGGFGGAAFPASTSALVMGGGGGGGTTNNGTYCAYNATNGTCTTSGNGNGIYSSGGAGGGIVIIHAGSVVGTGTITSNGQTTLSTLNDSTGGGGAGGSILVFANSGGLSGLTVNANGGNGGYAWPIQTPNGFPGQRHGPGGGGGGGVIFLTASPTASTVTGGINGFTNTVQDSYGATIGSAGTVATTHVITETPGTQSGAYCGTADLSITNTGAPSVVAPGGQIVYSQPVTNNGPLDAVNAVFSESTPANTTFALFSAPSGWTCTLPAVNTTGTITCTDPDVPKGGPYNFSLTVNVLGTTPSGTQIVDVVNVVSGTTDPNLTNNSATAVTTVGAVGTADLQVVNTASAPTTVAGTNVTMTAAVSNLGPSSASGVVFTEAVPANTTVATTFVAPSGWACSSLPAGSVAGTVLTCTVTTLTPTGATPVNFPLVLTVASGTASGTVISADASVSSTTPDPNALNNESIATTIVASSGQSDLAVTSSAAPNPVTQGNNITYTQVVSNNGPAAATAATFSDTIPTGTTFASFTAPANWTCNSIPIGGTGTITCTLNLGKTIAVGASGNVNFNLAVNVNLTTTSGTNIANTANINVPCSSTTDPNCSNNSASTTVVVASPTQADVSIVKTAAPEPVTEFTNLTYTLVVSNNGPAIAQNVSVTDNIPSTTTFTSVSPGSPTCTTTAISVTTPYPSTTQLNCSLGSIGVGNQVVITVNVNAATFSSSSLTTNTATVSSTTGDPNTANNTSTAISTIQASTAVGLTSLNAYRQPNGTVVVEWHTQEESRNLGFHVYRDDALGRHRVSPSLIVGSALLLRNSRPQHAAKSYRWIDPQPAPDSVYWVEDVDINGTRTLHGPANVESAASAPSSLEPEVAALPTAAVAAVQPRSASRGSAQPSLRIFLPRPLPPPPPVNTPVFAVADHAAVKISVDQEGWYSIPFSQLYAAGLDPNSDPRALRLFAEGVEQPMLLTGQGSSAAIEFYGTGIDTPFSGTRVYWLVREAGTPKRIFAAPAPSSGAPAPSSFPFTVIRQDRVSYFAALLNGENNDNFFGPLVTSDPAEQDLLVAHLDTTSSQSITLDVALQGVTDQQEHRVSIQLNGSSIGELDFYGTVPATQTFAVDASLLTEGTNAVTLTALEGDFDVSLVQSVALHYPHTYAADSDWLRATVASGSSVEITGFSNAQVRAFDITDPLNITELPGKVSAANSAFQIALNLPQSSVTQRTILAFASDAVSSPGSLASYTPSFIDQFHAGADIVMISYPDFVSSLAPLVRLRESQGHHVQVVTTDQLFDTYNFGERSPFAMRAFLQNAASHWSLKPQSVLLVGDASFDPRDYLGFGQTDFTPTRIIQTAAFKTASDDWFSDFQQTGYATLPTGRLPVHTVSDADLVVSKIVNYEQRTYAGAWNSQAIFIADQNVDSNFSNAASAAATNLPSAVTPSRIFTDGLDTATAHSQILNALNAGALIVNYDGHGAEQQWSFSDIFDNNDAQALNNSGRLPVYLLMDCLNGFFQDVYAESLSKAIILAPNGGGVAVWASSGFTDQPPQATMDQALLRQFQMYPTHSLGKLILDAKSGTTDADVRRTWILFGDPAMKLQLNASPAASNASSSTTRPSQPVSPVTPLPAPVCAKSKVCSQGGSQQ